MREKGESGISKGCALLKFKLKEEAILAIRDLNSQVYICGATKPLEVRFAESKKMKNQ